MATNLLVSIHDFAISRGVADDPTDEQAIIALEGASSLVRTYCDQLFDYVEDEEITLRAPSSGLILLPELPVVDLTEVVSVDGTDETVLEVTDYDVDLNAGILTLFATGSWPWYPSWWAPAPSYLRVIYSHGYLEIPSDLQMVVMAVASRNLQQASSGGYPIQQETVGSYSVTYGSGGGSTTATFGGLLDLEKTVLSKYRRRAGA